MGNPAPSPVPPPLGTGPPTKAELEYYYPGRFTWEQLKVFVNSGDLGLLKRHKGLQKRYSAWQVKIKAEYGSMVKYLNEYRLRWGQPDDLSILGSELPATRPSSRHTSRPTSPLSSSPEGEKKIHLYSKMSGLSKMTPKIPEYFTADTPKEYISIIQNDWPYSVPSNVEHTLVWTSLPLYHPKTLPTAITARVNQDGLWGFTGLPPDPLSPHTPPAPPSPELLPTCLPALSEWDVKMEDLVKSERGTDEEEEMVKKCGWEVNEFIRRRWQESEWECAWFVNPPVGGPPFLDLASSHAPLQRLQSVPGLAHIHVFARHKTPEEIAFEQDLKSKSSPN